MVAAPLIVATGIYKRLGNAAVLRGVDLQAHSSEVIAILGASGSGKSTLLRCLNVLEIPDEGSLTLFNEPIEYVTRHGKRQPVDNRKVLALRQRIAMVFQQFQLWTHMTALGNVSEAPYRVLKLSKQDAIDRARAYLDKVGMLDFAHAFPSQLSGGQKQRVAIARALAMNPDVILFDEPTSALDPELVGEVLKVIRALAEGARCLIIVTHEIQFARDVADTIIFLHEGIVAEHGPVTCLDNPQTAAFKRFLARFAGNDSDYTL